MLHSSFKSGSSASGRGTSNAMDYLLGEDRERDGARIIRGDENDTLSICKTIEQDKGFKYLYHSGVLSFEERDIPEEQKHEIMDSFETCLFADMDKDRYNILWIEHTDKDRLELNYMVPAMDLQDGKTLSVYHHDSDKNRVKAWQEITNHEYGLTSPDAPEKKKYYELASDLSRDRMEASREISLAVQNKFLSGDIQDRAGVKDYLHSGGYEVTRETKNSLSVNTEQHGTLRLKGEIFKATPDTSIVSREHQEMLNAASNPAANEAQYQQHKETYAALLERRNERLAERNHMSPEMKQHYREKKAERETQKQAPATEKTAEKKPETPPEKSPAGLSSKQAQEITRNLEPQPYNREIINTRNEVIKNHEQGVKAEERRITYLEQMQADRRGSFDQRFSQWQERQDNQQQKDSQFLGLGRFLTTGAEREKFNQAQTAERDAIEKERAAIERSEYRLSNEKDLADNGYTKDDIKAIRDATYQFEKHTAPESKLQRQEQALSTARDNAHYARLQHSAKSNKIFFKPEQREINQAKYQADRLHNYEQKIRQGVEQTQKEIRQPEYQEKRAELKDTLDKVTLRAEMNTAEYQRNKLAASREAERPAGKPEPQPEQKTPQNGAQKPAEATRQQPEPAAARQTRTEPPAPRPSILTADRETLKHWNQIDAKNEHEKHVISRLEQAVNTPDAPRLREAEQAHNARVEKLAQATRELDGIKKQGEQFDTRYSEKHDSYQKLRQNENYYQEKRESLNGFGGIFKGGEKRELDEKIRQVQEKQQAVKTEMEQAKKARDDFNEKSAPQIEKINNDMRDVRREDMGYMIHDDKDVRRLNQAEKALEDTRESNQQTQSRLDNFPYTASSDDREKINTMREDGKLSKPKYEQDADRAAQKQDQSQDHGMSF